MKVKELIGMLECYPEDYNVAIPIKVNPTNMISCGVPSVAIISASEGFDWNCNMLFLYTNETLTIFNK